MNYCSLPFVVTSSRRDIKRQKPNAIEETVDLRPQLQGRRDCASNTKKGSVRRAMTARTATTKNQEKVVLAELPVKEKGAKDGRGNNNANVHHQEINRMFASSTFRVVVLVAKTVPSITQNIVDITRKVPAREVIDALSRTSKSLRLPASSLVARRLTCRGRPRARQTRGMLRPLLKNPIRTRADEGDHGHRITNRGT